MECPSFSVPDLPSPCAHPRAVTSPPPDGGIKAGMVHGGGPRWMRGGRAGAAVGGQAVAGLAGGRPEGAVAMEDRGAVEGVGLVWGSPSNCAPL